MPKWSIGVFLILGAACSSPSPVVPNRGLILLDGNPVISGSLPGGIEVTFNGDADLRVRSGGSTLVIDPRTPAILTASAKGEVLLLNYGDGSGQIYSLEAYNLRTSKKIDISGFLDGVFTFAKQLPGCRIRQDQISFSFSEWMKDDKKALIRTEDFSRTKYCDRLNRNWILPLN